MKELYFSRNSFVPCNSTVFPRKSQEENMCGVLLEWAWAGKRAGSYISDCVPWDQAAACWAAMICCLSVDIPVWELFRNWRKVTPSKGWILEGPRHGICVNTRHCMFRLSPHIFFLPGLLHHCYHCSDFHSSIVTIWRFDNFFKCWVNYSLC